MIARAGLLAAAAAVLVLLATSERHHDACDAARRTIFAVTLGHASPARQPAAIAAVRAHCRGTTGLVDTAGALQRQGRDREALALARDAAAREPDSAAAWSAIAASAQAPALARAAERRLAALDPLRSPLSLKRSAGRSTR